MAATSGAAGTSDDLKLQQLMHKLAGIEPLTASDVRAIDEQVTRRPTPPARVALPVPEHERHIKFYKDIGDVYAKGINGLTERGWTEFGNTKYLGSGLYGRVTLGMRLKDRDKAPHKRLLCAIKVQNIDEMDVAWKEVAVMRSLAHEHIIDYYDHFVVYENNGTTFAEAEQRFKMFKLDRNPGYKSPPRPEDEASARRSTPASRSRGLSPSVTLRYSKKTLWLLMEFADTGNLMDEMERFPNDLIPDSGILYYLKQILSGLEYMHGRGICHCDLHLGNILMKYQRDRTKKCLITDFGRAHIHTPANYMYTSDISDFAKNMRVLIVGTPNELKCNPEYLAKIGRSPEATDFALMSFRRKCPESAEQMRSVPWIASGVAVAPMPPLAPREKSPAVEPAIESPESPANPRSLHPVAEATSDEERSEELRHAAAAAVADDLRNSRPGLGARIRRSVSSLGRTVASRMRVCGSCLRPHQE